MGTSVQREALAIAAAIALHVGFLALRPRLGPSAVVATPEVTDIIELHADLPAPPPQIEPPAPSAAEAPAGGAAERSARAPAIHEPATRAPSSPPVTAGLPPAPPPAVAVAPAAAAPAPAAPPSTGLPPSDFSQPPPPDGVVGLPPGLGGAPIWSIPGVVGLPSVATAAPTAAPAARPVDVNVAGKVIDGTLRRRDRDLGLDAPAAGVVASTIADAVRSAAVPGDARASFEVRLGASGAVEGVRLLTASAGDAGAWERVVRASKGALHGRSLRVDNTAKGGATVVVKIESRVQFPAGGKTKVDVEPVCVNEIIDQLAEALKNPGAIGADSPATAGRGATLGTGHTSAEGCQWDEQRKKFCIPVGIRGRGDMSNAGAHAQTVVRSTFTVKRDGERALPAEDVLPVDTRVPWARPDPTLYKAPPVKKKKKKPGPSK